ncbi:MAG: adenylate kinase [Tannerellaceae bacterium]|jgi:adenylate kinase|nr:adenylate kinase [Tannerellaceae bacterium]
MLNIILLGAPGSGKGTQSDMLIKELELVHISTGEILRTEIQNKTELGKIAATYINRGQLVPDELTVDILAHTLDGCKARRGVIFDGFPRTIPQAEELKRLLNDGGEDISAVMELKVEEEELVRRLLERGKQSGRTDDNEETIRKRLEVYHAQTAPLSCYYIKEGKHHAIDGTGTVDEIFDRIKTICQTL